MKSIMDGEFGLVYQDAIAATLSHIESEKEGKGPASGYAPLPQILATLDAERWIAEGGMTRESFSSFLAHYLRHSVQLHHPAHIAHQVSVPDYPAAVAAAINGLTNNPMAIYEMGPAAAAIEFAVINWMLEKIGWSPQPVRGEGDVDHSAGVLTHGGSLANLTALLAARGTIAPKAWEEGVPSDLVVLAPAVSHYSLARSVSILGLGSQALYALPTNEWGVVEPDALQRSLDEIKASGKRCMALVANACATATGLHDPLRELGEFCQRNSLWFHVDACHGASALLDKRVAHYLDGVELADSVVWDTHKMLQVPALCAAVLFKDPKSFERAFHQEASYLAYGQDLDSYDSLPRAIECTKAALGFKIFMNLAWRGEQSLGAYVYERYAAAHRFWQLISDRDGFECACEPESNILCFRYGNDDELQVKIRDELVRTGRFHITSAEVNQSRWMRLTVMNPLTDEKIIVDLLDAIEELAAKYAKM